MLKHKIHLDGGEEEEIRTNMGACARECMREKVCCHRERENVREKKIECWCEKMRWICYRVFCATLFPCVSVFRVRRMERVQFSL